MRARKQEARAARAPRARESKRESERAGASRRRAGLGRAHQICALMRTPVVGCRMIFVANSTPTVGLRFCENDCETPSPLSPFSLSGAMK